VILIALRTIIGVEEGCETLKTNVAIFSFGRQMFCGRPPFRLEFAISMTTITWSPLQDCRPVRDG
jgi:hypothetical protein